MQNDLTENQLNRLKAYQMQPEFQEILMTLARAVRRPEYKKGGDPFKQIPDMIFQAGKTKGAFDVLSLLSGNEEIR